MRGKGKEVAGGARQAKPAFSTNELRIQDRFDYFQSEILAGTFGLTGELTSEKRDGFFAEIDVHLVGDVVVIDEYSTPYDVRRSTGDIARTSPDTLTIFRKISGGIGFEIDGVETFEMQAGDIHTGTVNVPFSGAARAESVQQTSIIVIPMARFGVYANQSSLFLPKLLRPTSGINALLSSYVSSFADQAPYLGGVAAEIAVQTLTQLLTACLVDSHTQEPSTRNAIRNACLQRILELIERDLHLPVLSAESIANALGVSPRHLYSLFEPTGASFARYVLSRRLATAEKMLLSQPTRGIADIAGSCGIDSLRTFYRAFQAAYGMSARDYRASRLAPR